jgi:SEC-C motif-containing protein
MLKNHLCPCHSKKKYSECCQPYHEGKICENALKLMRSRYSAYALNLPEYIIQTTHPENPQYTLQESWKKQIEEFIQSTDFAGLDILEFEENNNGAYVTFTAHLKQNGEYVSFTEKSFFVKENGKWFYKDGQIQQTKR